MKVSIKAQSITQVLNADVVNVDQVKRLTTDERREILRAIMEEIVRQSEMLEGFPSEISKERIRDLAEGARKTVGRISESHDDVSETRSSISDFLSKAKDNLGSVSDILINILKIAQIAGLK